MTHTHLICTMLHWEMDAEVIGVVMKLYACVGKINQSIT